MTGPTPEYHRGPVINGTPVYVDMVGGPTDRDDVDWTTAPRGMVSSTADPDAAPVEVPLIPVSIHGHTALGMVDLTLWMTVETAAALRLVARGSANAIGAGAALVGFEDQMTMVARENGRPE